MRFQSWTMFRWLSVPAVVGLLLAFTLNTGARYNPVSNKWTTVATTTAPARANHTAVWANGYQMIIWGGVNGTTYYADFKRLHRE